MDDELEDWKEVKVVYSCPLSSVLGTGTTRTLSSLPTHDLLLTGPVLFIPRKLSKTDYLEVHVGPTVRTGVIGRGPFMTRSSTRSSPAEKKGRCDTERTLRTPDPCLSFLNSESSESPTLLRFTEVSVSRHPRLAAP